MSKTLTMIDAGWDFIRALAARGQKAKALEHLTRLLACPDVPAKLAAEGNRFAGELALDTENYTAARRQLNAALALEPTHAGTRFALGRAWEDDPDGCDRRAAICFKKAMSLDAANTLYRVAFGRAAARCGKVKLGVREMLAAVEAAMNDLTVIRVAVSGLLEVGKVKAARQVIAKARFLAPCNAELATMWMRVKFEAARLTQVKLAKTVKANTRYAQDALIATEGDRVVLPFIRTVGAKSDTVRRDVASFPRPHIARLRVSKADY